MMAKRRPKDIGTAAESAVVRWLQANGWPHAERRALRGSQDAGDITGTPGICWEVKAGQAAIGASDATISSWLIETRQQAVNGDASIGVLIQRRRGKAHAGDWWAWLTLRELVDLADDIDGHGDVPLEIGHVSEFPCRLRLADLAAILHRAGYGDPT